MCAINLIITDLSNKMTPIHDCEIENKVTTENSPMHWSECFLCEFTFLLLSMGWASGLVSLQIYFSNNFATKKKSVNRLELSQIIVLLKVKFQFQAISRLIFTHSNLVYELCWLYWTEKKSSFHWSWSIQLWFWNHNLLTLSTACRLYMISFKLLDNFNYLIELSLIYLFVHRTINAVSVDWNVYILIT